MGIVRAVVMAGVVMVVVMGVIVFLGVIGMVMILPMRVIMVLRVVTIMVMALIVMVMTMSLEQRVFADVEQHGRVRLQKRQHRRIAGERLHRACHRGRQIGAHPDDDIRRLERRGLGRAQAVAMGRGAGPHDQIRRADAVHDARHQRMDRRDIDRDTRHVGQRGTARQDGGCGEAEELSGHRDHPVIL